MRPSIPALTTLALLLLTVPELLAQAPQLQAPEPDPFAQTLAIHNQMPPGNKKRIFEKPQRLRHLQVERIVKTLALKPGQRVLDFGAGSGLFSVPLAKAVGPTGTLLAVEIQPGLVKLLEQEALRQGLTGLKVLLGDQSDPAAPLQGHRFDLVFLSSVYEFLPEPQAFFRALGPTLEPGARVVLIHPRMIPRYGPTLPPDHEALVALGQQTDFRHPIFKHLSAPVLRQLVQGPGPGAREPFAEALCRDLNDLLEEPSLLLEAKVFHGNMKKDKDAIYRLMHRHQSQVITTLVALYPEPFLSPSHDFSSEEREVVRVVNWLLLDALLAGSGGESAGGFGRSFLASRSQLLATMAQAGMRLEASHDFLPAYEFLIFSYQHQKEFR